MPEDSQFRVALSNENLVNRMSLLMLDTRHDNDSKSTRRKIGSARNASIKGISLPFVPHYDNDHESSDDSDKEEHIMKIDSPSALFHSSRPDQLL